MVLVGRRTEADALRDLLTAIAQNYTTTHEDLFISRYQPHRMPGNYRYMAVARIAAGPNEVPTILPDMQLIAVD